MKQKISNLNGHIIVCGAGDTGITIINEFQHAHRDFVVVENKPERVNELLEKDSSLLVIEGNATKDEILEEANIKNASGLITTLSLDADNLFVVVSARALNPEMNIISRAVEPNTESKLYNAGANYVISPNMVEGIRMASVILRPTVVNFLEVMTRGEGLLIQMEEISIQEDSIYHGKPLSEIKIPQRTGLIVLAVRQVNSKKWDFNPGPDFVLKASDKIIVLGEHEKITKLQNMLNEQAE
jgi:voltage-gated potassium channel